MEVGDFHRIGESDHVVVSLFVTTPVIRMLPWIAHLLNTKWQEDASFADHVTRFLTKSLVADGCASIELPEKTITTLYHGLDSQSFHPAALFLSVALTMYSSTRDIFLNEAKCRTQWRGTWYKLTYEQKCNLTGKGIPLEITPYSYTIPYQPIFLGTERSCGNVIWPRLWFIRHLRPSIVTVRWQQQWSPSIQYIP